MKSHSMMQSEVLIIGGGAIGYSTAYFLAQSNPRLQIVVLERDPTYEYASSARSASSLRQQFSTRVNVELSAFGFEFLTQCEAADAGVGLVERGYLFLARPEQEAALRQCSALASGAGAKVVEMDATSLVRRFPFLQCDDVSYGVVGESGEGWFDGYALMQTFRARAAALGVKAIRGAAERLICDAERVTSVRLSDGGAITADYVVIAAGAWSRPLAASAGVDLPVRARRRTAFALTCPIALPDFPILIDTSGVYVRPDGQGFVSMLSPAAAHDHDDLPLEPDMEQFEADIWAPLAHRIPAFESLRIKRAWAGYYEYNTIDQNGLVGRIGPKTLYVATGFSGHGLMHSAGVGRGLAELMTQGAFQTIDLSDLAPDRFARNQAIRETAIY